MSAPPPHIGTQNRPLLGIALMLLADLLLSSMDGIAKWVMTSHTVAQMMFVRSILVTLLMAPMIARAGGVRALKTRRPWGHALRAGFAVLAILCFFGSLRDLPLATAVAISFGAPLFMTALSVPVLREHVGPHRWGAVVVGLVGVLVIVRPDAEGALTGAALLALAGSVFFAGGMVTVRWLAKTETDLALLFWQNTGVLVVLGVVAAFDWRPMSWVDLALIASMAVLITAGQWCTVRAFRVAPVGVVAPFQYGELLWATLIGWLVWAELPAPHVWWGAAIVAASGLYVIWREGRHARKKKVAS